MQRCGGLQARKMDENQSDVAFEVFNLLKLLGSDPIRLRQGCFAFLVGLLTCQCVFWFLFPRKQIGWWRVSSNLYNFVQPTLVSQPFWLKLRLRRPSRSFSSDYLIVIGAPLYKPPVRCVQRPGLWGDWRGSSLHLGWGGTLLGPRAANSRGLGSPSKTCADYPRQTILLYADNRLWKQRNRSQGFNLIRVATMQTPSQTKAKDNVSKAFKSHFFSPKYKTVKTNYFNSCDPHHDIYTLSCFKVS
jgi:hypothetical protein